MNITQTTPAQSLPEVYRTLQPDPLTSPEELKAFYYDGLNQVRGGDKVQRLAQGLNRDHGVTSFKAFFMGHQGVGKSTELSRLGLQVADKFQIIRFSALNNLDPRNFKSLDIILTMIVDVAERTNQLLNKTPSEIRLREIWDWFATEKDTREQANSKALTIEGGAGVKADSWWGQILGLFATLKSEMKFAQNRKKEIIEYRFNRLPALIEIANRILDECNELLREDRGQEWLFIGEDFDKSAIPRPLIEDLFINNADVFRKLRVHMILTLPLSLYYSGRAVELPFANDRCFVLPDTHVFYQDHQPNTSGQSAIAELLAARMLPTLFEPDQMARLILASGGNLRNLFTLTSYAADTAALRAATAIGASDVHEAIENLRNEYQRRLGASPYDRDVITYQDKSDQLLKIYHGEQQDQIPNAVVYSLLESRAVQEFNGER
ncbi:MAG: hypothetical protein ACEQSC_00595, partial [Candidatus Nanopelagicaceae bacterium]